MTKTKTPADQLFHDLFVTAIEGGINYWAERTHYNWGKLDADGVTLNDDLEGFYALVLEDDGDEMREHRIDRTVVAKGYGRAVSADWRGKLNWSAGKPPIFLTAENVENWDFDAGDADLIVQLGLFNDVVYG